LNLHELDMLTPKVCSGNANQDCCIRIYSSGNAPSDRLPCGNDALYYVSSDAIVANGYVMSLIDPDSVGQTTYKSTGCNVGTLTIYNLETDSTCAGSNDVCVRKPSPPTTPIYNLGTGSGSAPNTCTCETSNIIGCGSTPTIPVGLPNPTFILGLQDQVNGGAGDCFPFGCYDDPIYGSFTEYQQIYDPSLFPQQKIAIAKLTFTNTKISNSVKNMNTEPFKIYLSTSTKTYATITTDFNNNLGSDNTLVFSGSLSQPWSFPQNLVITLTTPFVYDPTKGSLLLDIKVTSQGDQNGRIDFDADPRTSGTFTTNVVGKGGNTGVILHQFNLITQVN